MIPVHEALQIILSRTPPPRPCQVALEEALGLVLAEDVYSDMLIPPFDRATMDGYALCAADATAQDAVLRVIGESAAGHGFGGTVGSGEAVRIMTGAPVPRGADTVQIVEKTSLRGDQVIIREPLEKGRNVAPAGSEVGVSDKLSAGRFIGPAEMAVLASFGAAIVPALCPPRVAVLATGDELVDVAAKPGPDQIRNSNALSLLCQIRSLHIEPTSLGTAPDEEKALRLKMQEGVVHDVFLVTGGVSMGQYDLVGKTLSGMGAQIHFSRVAIKPGKPLTFATLEQRLVFGLPGNPVSGFVTFEVFVRPAIERLLGRSPGAFQIRARVGDRCDNHGPRDYYAPARTRWTGDFWEAEILKTRGSADIFRFSAADSLIILPAGSDTPPGAERTALLLSDYWERTKSS